MRGPTREGKAVRKPTEAVQVKPGEKEQAAQCRVKQTLQDRIGRVTWPGMAC